MTKPQLAMSVESTDKKPPITSQCHCMIATTGNLLKLYLRVYLHRHWSNHHKFLSIIILMVVKLV